MLELREPYVEGKCVYCQQDVKYYCLNCYRCPDCGIRYDSTICGWQHQDDCRVNPGGYESENLV